MAGYIGSKSSVTQVDGYSEAEADAEFVTKTGDTMSGNLNVTGTVIADELSVSDAGKLGFNTTSSYTINSVPSPDFGLGYTVSTNPMNLSGYYGIAFATNRTEAMRIDTSGNVGIGTSSPRSDSVSTTLEVSDSTTARAIIKSTGTGGREYGWYSSTSGQFGLYDYTADTERMRIDSSGNLLVGTTDSPATLAATSSSEGLGYDADDFLVVSRGGSSGQACLILNKLTSDGDIVAFRKDGATIGTIGVAASDNLYIGSTSTNHTGIGFGTNEWTPMRPAGTNSDNAINLGGSTRRFDNIWATNGTIQTSDFNEKQDIASLTATEMLVGARISTLFKTFRWKDRVVEKGDNARTHTGVIAQDVQAAFTAEGLDAGDYALFISSTWWEHDVDVPAVEAVAEVTDEDGNVTTEAVEAVDAYTRTDTYETEDEAPEGATGKTRLGIRYPELLSFVAAYNEQRFASIEARLTALEA